MKKLAAIFLIALFSFNLVGYRALFYYQQQQSSVDLSSRIDEKNYDEQDLITLRVNLDMPYQLQETSFERVDGEMEVNGTIYKYVKRKIDHGQLVLQCLPDKAASRIQSTRDSFFKISNALMQDKGGKGASSKQVSTKNIVSDFDENQIAHSGNYVVEQTLRKFAVDNFVALRGNRSLPERPPEQA